VSKLGKDNVVLDYIRVLITDGRRSFGECLRLAENIHDLCEERIVVLKSNPQRDSEIESKERKTTTRICVDGPDPACNCSERFALRRLMEEFSSAMFAKLEKKLNEGSSGWDDPDEFTIDDIHDRIDDHMHDPAPDPVDIANFAAFWWNRLAE